MNQVDWNSSQNFFFLNPKYPSDQAKELLGLVQDNAQKWEGHLFLLSSGTTAVSVEDYKWVALSKKAFLTSAAAVNSHLKIHEKDSWLNILPGFHVGGLAIEARAYLSGSQVDRMEAWNAAQFMEIAHEKQTTLTALVSAQLFDLVQAGYRCPPLLRAVVVGGGALTLPLYQRARSLGWPVLPSYGMTEGCSQIATADLSTLNQSGDTLPEMKILPHWEVEALSDGKLRIRGESLLTAYFCRRSGADQVWDPKVSGWFVSQDRGEVRGQFLRVLGRTSDFVKVGGESVEVDRLREVLEDIRIQKGIQSDLALLPVPDERLGHVIHLFLEDRLTEEVVAEVTEIFNSRVLGFERIRKAHRVFGIPRTALGKLIPAECLRMIGV